MRVMKVALHRRSVRWALVLVVALFLAFEVTVRHLPPDGVTVTETSQSITTYIKTPQGQIPRYATTTTTQTHLAADSPLWRTQIQQLSNDLNTGSVSTFAVLPSYACETLAGPTNYQVTFTWHDLPVQIWTSLYGCPTYMENSGGIPNVLWARILPYTEEPTLNSFLEQ